MMEEGEPSGGADARSGLLVLTGASHTGKTSVARALLSMASPPVALVGVDQLINETLVHPLGDPWREIPLAYELLRPQVKILLCRGWSVVLETTFTFVPEYGEPEMHLDQLEAFLRITDCLSLPSQVVQLLPDRQTVRKRAAATGRLDLAIVAKTLDLHDGATFPPGTLTLGDEESSPEDLARAILATLDFL
jgi:hypothetical protein